MSWKPYDLDHVAQGIVLAVRERVEKESKKKEENTNSDDDIYKEIKETMDLAYKMRSTCAFGLERFWGEHLRLSTKEPEKAAFVADVWRAFAVIMREADIKLPLDLLTSKASEAEIKKIANRIWNLKPHERQVALAVLTKLCDSVVWWTQRLKPPKPQKNNQGER